MSYAETLQEISDQVFGPTAGQLMAGAGIDVYSNPDLDSSDFTVQEFNCSRIERVH